MGSAAVKLDISEFDDVFGSIAKLYDHAENIIKIAYDESIANRDKFIEEIEGLVAQIEESANTIAEDFGIVASGNSEPTNAIKIRVSSALRKVLIAIEDYKKIANLKTN